MAFAAVDRAPRSRMEAVSAMSAEPFDLEAIFKEHHDCVWRTLRAMGLSPSQVDDAVQEIFLVAHRRRADYDGRASVRAWLLGIARKVAPRILGRAARGRSLSVEELRAPGDADERLERTRAARRVARFLSTLDEDQRRVFVLAEIEGFTAVEIAQIVGASVNTVYSRLRLARARFSRMSARVRAAQERRRVRSR